MNPRLFNFENLNTWQKARSYTQSVYISSKGFPPEERFGIISQLRRSTISICSNLAEGCGKESSKEKAYYTTTAFSSLLESLNQIIIAYDLTRIIHGNP